MDELMDDDGENLAVRAFLAKYQSDTCTTQIAMCLHLKASGFDCAWPKWAEGSQHLTKLGAQIWIRYLFALEPRPAIPSLTDAEIRDISVAHRNENGLLIMDLSFARAIEKAIIERMKGGGE